MARAAPLLGWAPEYLCQGMSPLCGIDNKNVSDNSRNKTRYGSATLSAGCGSAAQVSVLIWRLWRFRLDSSRVAGDTGIFMGCPQRPQADPLWFREESIGCLVPSPGFSPLAARKASKQAAIPDTACEAGAERPLPEQPVGITGHIRLAPQVQPCPARLTSSHQRHST